MTDVHGDDVMAEPRVPRPEPTGLDAVDAVVDAVADLDTRPLEEHVAVFEQAHDQLRRTLDHTPSGSGGSGVPGPRG